MEAGISRHVLVPFRANEEDLMIAVQSDASVLITSQRADERRNCARSIHVEGSRRAGPWVEFDCGAHHVLRADRRPTIREDDAVASELRRRFGAAFGGTVFLDRIDMMSNSIQGCLTFLLDEKIRHRDADVPDNRIAPRLVTGASASVLAAISAGTFSEALFYRLNVIHLDFRLISREGALMNGRSCRRLQAR
jgi:DNA-binding NtrC family response regulator